VAVKRAGIAPPPTWHDLRHSHVSRLFAAGADPVYIATRVGDSVKTMLDVYAHEYSDARRRASESEQLAALYDHGSAVEAPGSNRAQQRATALPSDLATQRAKRSTAQ
jgi:hypothetical protein